jgi:hypothetical protein
MTNEQTQTELPEASALAIAIEAETKAASVVTAAQQAIVAAEPADVLKRRDDLLVAEAGLRRATDARIAADVALQKANVAVKQTRRRVALDAAGETRKVLERRFAKIAKLRTALVEECLGADAALLANAEEVATANRLARELGEPAEAKSLTMDVARALALSIVSPSEGSNYWAHRIAPWLETRPDSDELANAICSLMNPAQPRPHDMTPAEAAALYIRTLDPAAPGNESGRRAAELSERFDERNARITEARMSLKTLSDVNAFDAMPMAVDPDERLRLIRERNSRAAHA